MSCCCYRFVLSLFTVSFHNFKSQNFKLSVSNPKSKYVAYVSVLSQFSNCQGLGRKNKHEILKTDRTACFVWRRWLGTAAACRDFIDCFVIVRQLLHCYCYCYGYRLLSIVIYVYTYICIHLWSTGDFPESVRQRTQ